MGRKAPRDDEPNLPARVMKTGFVLFGLILLCILVAAWLVGDQANLPFDYDGFD